MAEELATTTTTTVCINETLTDDELRSILTKLESDKDKEGFGLVCKRWLHLQSTERKKLCARAGPLMLRKMAARFSRLHELDLSQSASRSFYPGVTDSDLSVIAAGFRSLMILKLQNCKGITDVGMIALGNGLPSLQSLDVSYCRKLTDKGLTAIATGCHNLRSLHLVSCRFITDVVLEALAKNCSNLEDLGLLGCFKITDSGLAILVDGCRQIKLLDVSKCSNVGDNGVLSVTTKCFSLRTIKLLDCQRIGDNSIYSLAKSCKYLETLVIGGCYNISDESIKSVIIACNQNLKCLRMDSCVNVSDSSLKCIFSHCRNLEALDIGCCEEITDEAFWELGSLDFESSMKVLRVCNCPKITVSGIGWILKYCKSLEYLDVRCCPHVTKVGCDQAGLRFPEFCKVNFAGSLSGSDVVADVFL